MKYQSILFTIIAGSVLFLFNPVQGQNPKEEITFIKITDKIGFVIDSIENEEYKCILYVSKKEYQYSALIQLADSSVVLRIKLANQDGFRNVPMGKAEVDYLHKVLVNNAPKESVNDTIDELPLMQSLAGKEVSYKYSSYDSLKYQSLNASNSGSDTISQKPVAQENNFVFFHGGIGRGSLDGNGGFSSLLEFGVINKKNIFLVHYNHLMETDDSGSWLSNEKTEPLEKCIDIGFLYGRVADLNNICLSFSLGISYTKGVVRGDFNHSVSGVGFFSSITNYYDEIGINTIGIPFEADLFLGARHGFNCDFVFLGNINKTCSYFGILACMRIGAVKSFAHPK